MRNLLFKYANVFSNKPGSCKIFKHQIRLIPGFEPRRQQTYCIPQKLKEGRDRQLLMNHILSPHSEYSDCYIDDTAVFSSTWLKHLKHLEAVLKAFLDAGMTLRLSKCHFGKPKVTFVGHEIGSGTRRPLLNKIEGIMKIEEPKTRKLLKSFLGLCNYYRGYVNHFAALALPLTELTKNKYSNVVNSMKSNHSHL